MISWFRTSDGWSVNLDGTNAALGFSLPRIELHSSPRGWTCVCRLADGTARSVAIAASASIEAAKRAGIETGLVAAGPRYEPELRALLVSHGEASASPSGAASGGQRGVTMSDSEADRES